MVIACPACGTKYVVPDDALGIEGRTVRCAKCKHSWFQDGPAAEPSAADPMVDKRQPLASSVPEPAVDDTIEARDRPIVQASPGRKSARTASGDRWGVQPVPAKNPEPRAVGEDRDAGTVSAAPGGDISDGDDADRAPSGTPPLPDAAVTPPPFYRASDQPVPRNTRAVRARDAGSSQFDFEPPFRPRRNSLRLLTLAAASFAALALLTIAAVQLWGLPSWFPASQPMFAGEEPGLTMSFPDDRQQTRALSTGAEFLAVSGTIVNIGRETRSVPPILLVLRDQRNRVVFSQEIAPPADRLAPGESREVNEAIADIPPSATAAEFGWAPR